MAGKPIVYVAFGLSCFLVCHQQYIKSKAGNPYSPVTTKFPPLATDAGARILKAIKPPNAIAPPSPSHFHAMMRPMNTKSMKAVIGMRSLSIAMRPFSTLSATNKNKNTATESVPIILANQRMIITDRVEADATCFIFTSNL